ncbi:MAG: putative toxin-antitoxin system toxin component, PIN family [Anaerolineae bacterium]|nr:putative toxin-antitoxin system toxin component, PIN family [Anaerolineae bacterium]
MTNHLRAVLDTNVFVSTFLSRSPTNPTQELINRWLASEFTLLICDAIVDELIEKLVERGIAKVDIENLAALLNALAEWVSVPNDSIKPVIIADADDDVVVACALVGGADFLVTYDPHIGALGDFYEGVWIAKALPFLWAIRGDQPHDTTKSN